MRCGNVREIFIFIQRASRGSGKAKAGRTQLHPCQESCRSQNASNSVAKHFSLEKKPKAWVMLAIQQLLPNLGEARCKALTRGSPPRGEMTSMNDSNSTMSCLGKKAHQEPLRCHSEPSPMGWDLGEGCPAPANWAFQHSTGLPRLCPMLALEPRQWLLPEGSTQLAQSWHGCFSYMRFMFLKLTSVTCQ